MAVRSGFIDSAAHVIAIFVIILVPVVGHQRCSGWCTSCSEKIAEKRITRKRTPSRRSACCRWSSAACSGPLAWLWAYSRPVFHKMAYGTDKHEDSLRADRARAG